VEHPVDFASEAHERIEEVLPGGGRLRPVAPGNQRSEVNHGIPPQSICETIPSARPRLGCSGSRRNAKRSPLVAAAIPLVAYPSGVQAEYGGPAPGSRPPSGIHRRYRRAPPIIAF